MTKKSLSKVLSIIFTISICVTAVCGCVIATNALDTPEYVIQGSQCNKGDVSASAVVTFTMPEGMGVAAGTFTVDNAGGWYKEMTATVEKADQSDMVDVFTEDGVALFQIYDSESAPKLYNTVTVNLDFVFKDGGITDTVKIKLSDVELNGIYSDENYTNVADNSTNAYFTVGCQHVYVVSGDPVSTSEKFDYSVYNSATCTLCGETKNAYQVVPKEESDEGEVVIFSGAASSAKPVELLDSAAPNSESNPYIIELPVQLLALSRGVLKNTAGEEVSAGGYYYKVKDGIKAFVMQGVDATTASTIMSLSSADAVSEYFAAAATKTTYWGLLDSSKTFNGHFDGNGVEIYGIYSPNQATALFTQVSGTSSIKNLSVKNSYIAASSGAGVAAIVGKTPNDTNVDSVVIENIVVANNYIEQTGNQVVGANAIVGMTNSNTNSSSADQRDAVKIYDCLVYGNKLVNNAYTGTALKSGLVGDCTGRLEIKNVISLGVTPWTLNAGGWYLKQINDGTIANVYTDASQADWDAYSAYNANNTATNAKKHNINYALDVNSLKGDAAKTTASVLDWNTTENPDGIWFTGYNGQYPTLLKKNTQSVADGTNIDWELLGANIVYANDGSFALNFHYEPSYDSDVKLYVANAQNENKTKILTEHTASSFAGTILSADARMFTLSGISAKDINELWLPTIITTNEAGTEIVYGETVQISVGDYAESVVVGDAVYSEGATDAQKTADKNVAAALINYSQAAIDALSVTTAESATTATIIEKWDQYENGKYIGWYNSKLSGEGTEESPYIIDSAEKLAQLCRYGCEANVYYKVDDSIKAFDMNTVAGVDLTVDNITANEVKTAVADKILGKVWFCDAPFKGNFDGNGVTIYGLYAGPAYYNQASYDSGSKAGCVSGALFSKIDTSTATFKNFTIKNSYFTGGNCGAVFAETTLSGGSAKIDNVIVANCYIESTGGTGGAIGGFCKSSIDDTNKNYVLDRVVLNNCLVYDNVISNKNGIAPRLIGSIQAWHWNGTAKVIDANYCSFNNIIAIDCNIFESTSWWASQKGLFSKCYTTETNVYYNTTITDITQLANADAAKGIAAKTNMPALDWDTIWMYGGEGEYPSIVLTKGKVNPVSEYSGTPDTSSTLEGSGTVEDPYIIATADQFAAIALGRRATVENTYYKVKDGIKAFYMHGGAESAAFTNVEQVKNYFENQTTPTSSTWAKSNNFKANFDGNGVTVYGLFAYNVGKYTYTGLFPQIEGHTSIKNITIKNSYISSDCSDGLGALVGASVWKSDGTYENSVELENIAIINNYICQRGAYANGASAITGSLFNKNYASLNNGIIYGNQLDNSAYTGTGLVSSLFTANPGIGSGDAASAKIQNVIALGVTPWLIKTTATGYTHTNWYLANLSAGAFKNIYTDQSVAALQTYNATNNSDANLSKNNINVVSPSSLQGANAVTTMASAGLGWNTTWFAGNYKDYPSFSPASTMPTNVQLQYDAITLDTCDSYGNSTSDFGVYATSLNLNSNPYISFAFAFGGEYRANRDKITVKFTYTVNGTEQTFTTSPSAFTGDGTINGTNNWYNRPSAGRYHTYRFKDIPVEALANPIKVEASYNGGEYVNLGSFSAEGLALDFEREYRLNPCDYYATRIEAVKALLFYTQMIEIRYGA